jgi:hypothetical protein
MHELALGHCEMVPLMNEPLTSNPMKPRPRICCTCCGSLDDRQQHAVWQFVGFGVPAIEMGLVDFVSMGREHSLDCFDRAPGPCERQMHPGQAS